MVRMSWSIEFFPSTSPKTFYRALYCYMEYLFVDWWGLLAVKWMDLFLFLEYRWLSSWTCRSANNLSILCSLLILCITFNRLLIISFKNRSGLRVIARHEATFLGLIRLKLLKRVASYLAMTRRLWRRII